MYSLIPGWTRRRLADLPSALNSEVKGGPRPLFVLRMKAVARLSVLMFFALALLGMCGLAAQDASLTEITPHVLVFSTSTGMSSVRVGDDGALLIGTPSAASTAAISKILAEHTSSPVRYLVVAAEDLAHSQGRRGMGQARRFCRPMQEERAAPAGRTRDGHSSAT